MSVKVRIKTKGKNKRNVTDSAWMTQVCQTAVTTQECWQMSCLVSLTEIFRDGQMEMVKIFVNYQQIIRHVSHLMCLHLPWNPMHRMEVWDLDHSPADLFSLSRNKNCGSTWRGLQVNGLLESDLKLQTSAGVDSGCV